MKFALSHWGNVRIFFLWQKTKSLSSSQEIQWEDIVVRNFKRRAHVRIKATHSKNHTFYPLQSTCVLTFWSQCQVLPCSMSAMHSGAAAGCVQGPAHTWLGISRPPAQALLKATHGRQGRSGGCESRKKNRLQIKVLKVSVWAKILLITTRQLLLSAFSIVLDLNKFFFSQFSFVRLSPVMAGSLFW